LDFTNCIGQGMHKSWEPGRLIDSILALWRLVFRGTHITLSVYNVEVDPRFFKTLWTPGTGHLFVSRCTESHIVSLHSINAVFLTPLSRPMALPCHTRSQK
jgi:hypothetical protein